MKNLIIYFSRADENYMENGLQVIEKGNTQVLAEMIQNIISCDLFKVQPVKDYPFGYYDCCEVSKKELENNERIELKEYLTDISNYDTIYILSPIWWSHIPMALISQLEKLDFTGKTVKFAITHEGSGLGDTSDDIHKYCSSANIKDGFAFRGCKISESLEEINKFINS